MPGCSAGTCTPSAIPTPKRLPTGREKVDPTGWTLIFTLKFHRMQPDDEAVLQKRMTVSGTTAVMYLAPEKTNELTPFRYEFDVQVTTPDGQAVSTVAIGTVVVQAGVTHALR